MQRLAPPRGRLTRELREDPPIRVEDQRGGSVHCRPTRHVPGGRCPACRARVAWGVPAAAGWQCYACHVAALPALPPVEPGLADLLSVRLIGLLESQGIRTVAALREAVRTGRRLKQIGPKSMVKIFQAMQSLD